jgi:hypothetical protein
MEVWRRRGEAASAGLSVAAPYSAHHKLYSEAVVSSAASAVALVDVGQFREAVQYVQKAAKALYEAAKEVFEKVKATVQRLVELFVEAVTRVLAWIDEHRAYLFLMAAVAAGAVALSAALNMWGMIELDKLAYAASLTPFIPAGVKEYSREEALRILRSAPDPYEKFREIAKAASAGRLKLAEPWESLRMLVMPKPSEERELMRGRGAELYSKYRGDENYKRALFYATLALEEAFGIYRTALREVAEGLREAVEKREVGEGPFKRIRYMLDLGRLAQLAEKEEAAFEDALRVLRERLNEYAVKYGLRELLDVKEDMVRRLTEAPELHKFNDMNSGTKALAALIAYREYALGRWGAFGKAAGYWLEVGGSAWLLYYAPWTAYVKAEKTKVVRPVAVEEMAAEALRRLFLKPGADHHRGLVEELTKGGRLALELEEKKTKEKTESYVFRLYRLEEGSRLEELGVRLSIKKVRESIIYALEFDDVERWQDLFKQELEAAEKAAEEVVGRLPVEDRFSYMAGWVDSDVAISGGLLQMGTSHLWQLAETHALFNWSYITVPSVGLTLEGPKPQFYAHTSLEKLDEAIKKSAEDGWLKMLGTKAGLEDLMDVKSWDGLKRWVADHWGIVVDTAVKRLGEEIRSELEALRDRLNDDKVAREVVAPALLLIQAEKLGVDEETLRYFGAVNSGAIGGDGHVSAARKEVGLTSGKRGVALLWAAALAAHGIKAEVRKVWSGDAVLGFQVIVSGDDAARLAGLYFLYGASLLEGGDDRLKSHKLAGAVELGAEGLSVSWEGLRRTPSGHVAADVTISVGGAAVKYNVYLRRGKIELEFQSTDRGRVELAARLLKLTGVDTEVMKKGSMDIWRVLATTGMLVAGREELRNAIAEIVREAITRGWVDEKEAGDWLKELERGRVLKEGWPSYEMELARSGALRVRFRSPNLDSIKREAQRLREIGLEEGVHFTVKMPEGGQAGYVSVLKEGLAYAARLSVRGEGKQRDLAAAFVEYILQRAEKEGEEVYEKAKEIIEEGKAWSALKLENFEKKVEVNGKTYVVKVIGGEAVEEDRGGRKLLRIRITAEVGRVEGEHIVDRVVREYTITFGRYGRNAAVGFAVARADVPGGREADAERLSALVEALTGVKPRIRRLKDGTIVIECYGGHLEGFRRFAELADAIEKWLEEAGR